MFETTNSAAQIGIFVSLTMLIAILTYWKVHGKGAERAQDAGSTKEVFLAGGGLTWLFVAGSITLTNLSTEQLVGMNGNQMLLLAWWEISGFVGLLILAYVFVPIYYRNNCTTVTELLERRYKGGSIRTVISALFLLGNILIYLPAALYSGSLFLKSMFGVDWSLIWFAAPMAIIAAIYTITGGLRAVAVMDTYSGIGVLAIAFLVVILALAAVGFDLSTVPAERTSMIGSIDSPIPFHTLFTGMIFIQIFYWSTNQNITQKAMTAPTVKEAQKGFAAMMMAAVIAHTSAILNSSVALYAVDFHDKFIRPVANHWRLAAIVSVILTITSVLLVPVYENAKSIINLLQQLNGLSSMPILSAFITGLLFRNMDARAAIAGLGWGVALYAFHNFILYVPDTLYAGETFYQHMGIGWLHYIDVMAIVLVTCVLTALTVNRIIFGNRAVFIWSKEGRRLSAIEA